jgi:hypothetical protein
MINQIQFNIDNCSQEEIRDENNEKMIKIKDGIESFDIRMLSKQTNLRLNKLDKTKNILIKEL